VQLLELTGEYVSSSTHVQPVMNAIAGDLVEPVQCWKAFEVVCGELATLECTHRYFELIGVGGDYERLRKGLSHHGAVEITDRNRELLDSYKKFFSTYCGRPFVDLGNMTYACAMKGLAYSLPKNKRHWYGDGIYNEEKYGDCLEAMLGCAFIANTPMAEMQIYGEKPPQVPPVMEASVLFEYKVLIEATVEAVIEILNCHPSIWRSDVFMKMAGEQLPVFSHHQIEYYSWADSWAIAAASPSTRMRIESPLSGDMLQANQPANQSIDGVDLELVRCRKSFDVACGELANLECKHRYFALIGVGGEYEGRRKELSHHGAVEITDRNSVSLDSYKKFFLKYCGRTFVDLGNMTYACAMKGLAYSLPSNTKTWYGDGIYTEEKYGDCLEAVLGCAFIANTPKAEQQIYDPPQVPQGMFASVLLEYKALIEDTIEAVIAILERHPSIKKSDAFMIIVA
jgi:hypothetical protein